MRLQLMSVEQASCSYFPVVARRKKKLNTNSNFGQKFWKKINVAKMCFLCLWKSQIVLHDYLRLKSTFVIFFFTLVPLSGTTLLSKKFQKTLILAFDVHCFYQIYSFIHVLAQIVVISHIWKKRSFDWWMLKIS